MMDGKTLRAIQSMTAINDHGSAYHTAAVALGLRVLANQFARINRRHLALGQLPLELYHQRHVAYRKLMNAAKARMCPVDFKRFYAAF